MSAGIAVTTQQTARYLARNKELRQALGIADDAELVPHPLGRGEHNVNHVFADPATGRRYVLRVNVLSQPFHENQVAYEFAALNALAPSERVPQALYLDDSHELLPFGALVISFCPGRELDFDHLRPGDLESAAQLLADVHATPVPVGTPLFKPENPLLTLYRECLQRFEVYRASRFEDSRITDWVERFLSAVQSSIEASYRPDTSEKSPSFRIINTETLPSHFLLGDVGAGRLPGFMVDWERPIVGEVAQDLAYFTAPTTSYWDSGYRFDQRQAQEFVERYWQAVDGRFDRTGFDQRYKAYRMMTALRSTTWCCRALTQVESGKVTEKAQRKMADYLSDEFLELLAREVFGLCG